MSDLHIVNTDAEDFPFTPDLHALAHSLDARVVEVEGHEHDAISAVANTCDGLLVYRAWVDDALLERLPNCRVVSRCGTGHERIDVEAARRRGVEVTYVPDFCDEEMSDTVLMFVFAFARGVPVLQGHARRRYWPRLNELPPLRRLRGRQLSVLGFGSTGKRTAEKAASLGLDVLVWSRRKHGDAVRRLGGREVSFEDALAADFVSLHVPLTDETRHMIDATALRSFREHSVLINTARGAIVDTDALVAALRDDQIGGAGLDVVDPEPLPPEHELWTFPNVMISSHTGSLSVEAIDAAMRGALIDAVAVLRGNQPDHPVPLGLGAARTRTGST